ncbi:MAG: hypothetical protein ACREEW_06195, partial [Caulobacteraceae bacterium]
GEARLTAALAGQSAGIEALARRDRTRLAGAHEALAAWRRRAARVAAFSQAMAKPASSGDACERALTLDARFVNELKEGGL